MATTPNAAPTTANVTANGATATTSTITLTANSAATLAAAQTAIKQATGNAPPNTFAIGSTTSISQSTPGGKFVQGSTTTPALNAAVSSSPPAPNNGVSSVLSVQNILGAAALAGAGLAVFNKVSGGTNLVQSLVNNSNAATPASSTNNVQDPQQAAQAAQAATPVTPSTGSTNNVSDPAQRAQAAEQAATTVTTPNTNSTNNVTDPAQRAQVADQAAINNAQNVSTLQDPAQRQQAAITNADATSPTPVSTFSDPAQRAQAALPEPNTNSTTNVTDPAQRAQANQIAIENADNTAPKQVSTFSDPAQRGQAADQVAIDQAATTNNVTDPAQRAQANQIAIENADNTAPAQVSTFSDPAQRAQALDQAAIDQAAVTNNVQDPAQRAQARETVENYQAPAVDENNAETNRLVRANTAADIQIQNAAPPNTEIDENSAYPENPVDKKTLSDAEVEQQLQAAKDEVVANKEPRTPSDEEVNAAIQAAKDEAVQNNAAVVDENQDPAETARLKRAEDAAAKAEADANQSAAETNRLNNTNSGLTGAKEDTQSKATQQDAANFQAKPDWRVRLSLSPGAQAAKYLYWANPPGILAPLQATDGVIFPYTPAISVQYNASYDPTELTHSNYKFFTYRGSAVDSVTIGCDFTAQDTFEAQYLLAVVHFFKSITKMFYGQDQNPKNGTPPPLCYLSGLGAFQFDAHPLAITGFTYTLPTDVDYIKAGGTPTPPGVNKQNSPTDPKSLLSGAAQSVASRLGVSGLLPGAGAAPPNFQTTDTGSKDATYVPTKINISIQAVPIVTRNDISNKFSLKEYATGALLRGTKRAGGGIW